MAADREPTPEKISKRHLRAINHAMEEIHARSPFGEITLTIVNDRIGVIGIKWSRQLHGNRLDALDEVAG